MNSTIFNSMDSIYKDPVGPIMEGTDVRFSIRLDKVSTVSEPKLVIFRIDHWDQRQEVELKISNIAYGSTFYSCTFTPGIADVYFYYFTMRLNGKYVELKRGKFSTAIIGGQENECFQLTVYTKNISVPDFMKGAIFYQIFPDRFCYSGEPKENVPNDRWIHNDWYENPHYLPNDQGLILNNDYFRGDLKGIIQKLDYIKSLGATIIYLNPIFEAHSNHRYNTADYLKIDPMLGTEEDFSLLCAEAKKRGIRIILDGVFNHTGSDSIYFNREHRYDVIGAYNSLESMYASWFYFFDYPNGYESWWGHGTLPKINSHIPDCLNFLCTVVKKWIRLGASGFRLDVVDEISNSSLEVLSKSIKEEVAFDSHASVTGEVWEDVSIKEAYGERKHYFTQNTLDSAMNYVFKDALFGFFESRNAENFIDTVMRIIENYPKDNLDAMMNIISGHDIERAITRLAKEPTYGRDRYWQADHDYMNSDEYQKGRHLLKILAIMQYFLPGNPCLYYADEAGVYGYKDPHNRKTYPWGREDGELIDFFRAIGSIRNSHDFLKDAYFFPVIYDGGVCVFARESLDKQKRIYIAANLSDNPYDLGFIGATQVLYCTTYMDGTTLPQHNAVIIE